MTAGRLDDCGAVRRYYAQVVEVGVVMHEHGCNRLGLRLPGLHVGGQDLVIRHQLADGHRRTRSEEYFRARAEAHPSTRRGSILSICSCVFFGIITRQTIRRGTFTSVKDLIARIGTFIDGWNDRCQFFTWTKTADELLPHCKPGKRTSFTRH